jgi:sugar phosphate isomerase/epimerase
MRLYLSTWSLHRLFFARLIELTCLPSLARSLGFDGVELEDIWFSSTTPQYIKRLANEGKKHKTRLAIAISNDFTARNRAELREQITHVGRYLSIARALGNDVVRILMGRSRADTKAKEQVKESIRAVLPTAEKFDVNLAIENHDPLSRRADVMVEVLNDIGSPHLGVCLDFGNLHPSTRYRSIEALAPYAFIVHAKAYDFRSNGEERTINFRRCFSILRKVRFNGPVAIEYDGHGDQLMGTLKTLNLVRKYV